MEATATKDGAHHAVHQLQEAETCADRVALIVGVTGIVGDSLAEELLAMAEPKWKVYGISRRALPAWLQRHPIHHIQCDLLDREQSLTSLSQLTDVTHVFYVTWTSRSTEEENCRVNAAMVQNTLEPLLFNCKNLIHVCLQTGLKQYMGSHFSHLSDTAPIYREDAPRLPDMIFYYAQEDVIFNLVSLPRPVGFHAPISWSVHRPGIIFGISSLSMINSTLAFGIYASICKHERTPFVFPGTQATWESHFNCSDSRLVAKQEIWASTHAEGRNQAFNVSNGDDITWQELWQAIGGHFGFELMQLKVEPQSFVGILKGKLHVWDEMVKRYNLSPTKLGDFLGEWEMVDTVLRGWPIGKSSMEKSRALGFHESMDTRGSLSYWFGRMRQEKLIP